MGLFSFFRKNKQESAANQGEFFSRSARQSSVLSERTTRRAAKTESADQALPEKKRARRRLIGAMALVLAVVIILPMILDSEPKSQMDEMVIEIPSKELAHHKEVPVMPKAAIPSTEKLAVAPEVAVVPPSPASSVSEALVADKHVVEQEMPTVPPKANVKADVKETKPVVEPKAVVAPPTHKEAQVKPEATGNADETMRALAILEGRSQPTGASKPSAANGKFVIQVAALATQEKINELRNKLTRAGIKSYTQTVATQSGARTRIRVGPFASRDEADKMRVKINQLGLNATIVAG